VAAVADVDGAVSSAAPRLLARHPEARRFSLRSLKRRSITEPPSTLGRMSKLGSAYERKKFAAVLGWIRTLRVRTQGTLGASAFPRASDRATGSTFGGGGGIVTQPEWMAIWSGFARVDYDPILHVTAVKSRAAGRTARRLPPWWTPGEETLRRRKADKMISGWFRMTRQFTSFDSSLGWNFEGGLRRNDETNDDLLVLGEASMWKAQALFRLVAPGRRYKRRARSTKTSDARRRRRVPRMLDAVLEAWGEDV